MPPEPFVYEARFRGPKTVRMVIILLAFCALVLIAPAPLWARIFVIGACGTGLVILLAVGLSRKTALRVDAGGVRLCQSPFFRSAVAFYPWADVRQIVLWRYQRLDFIGVQRRKGAPEPTGPFTGPASRAAARKTAAGVDPQVAMTGSPRTAGSWTASAWWRRWRISRRRSRWPTPAPASCCTRCSLPRPRRADHPPPVSQLQGWPAGSGGRR